MTFPFGPTVTLITRGDPTGIDADGNDVYTPTSATVTAQFFNPGTSSEILGNQDTVISQPELGLPPGTVVGPIDAVTVGGVTYEVDGSPNSPTNPFTGWAPGVVVKLKQVTG